jgi:hypothetical protein
MQNGSLVIILGFDFWLIEALSVVLALQSVIGKLESYS